MPVVFDLLPGTWVEAVWGRGHTQHDSLVHPERFINSLACMLASRLVPLHLGLLPKPDWQSNPAGPLSAFPVAHAHAKNGTIAAVPPEPWPFEALPFDSD